MRFEHYNPSDESRSCVVRTMTKLTGKEYSVVKAELTELAKQAGCDTYNNETVFERYMAEQGIYKLEGCGGMTVDELELGGGAYCVYSTNRDGFYHLFPVVDSVIYDRRDDSRGLWVINVYKKEEGCFTIKRAERGDLEEILQLQYLAYQSEADLFGSRDIPPLKQTLQEVEEEFDSGIILKMTDENNVIIGSVRAREREGTVYIGKLMVRPDHRGRGLGTRLLTEIEGCFPGKRYELFTSTRSKDNIRLYERLGYTIFDQKSVTDELQFVYMEK